MAEEKFPPDDYLTQFQEDNCRGCYFADNKAVGTGEPCCTHISRPDIQGNKCYTRREVKSNYEGGISK